MIDSIAIRKYLSENLSPQNYSWVEESINIAKGGLNNTKFFVRFGRVYKYIEEKPVSADALKVFSTTHELVRFYLLISLGKDPDHDVLEKLFDTGNTPETITLYKSLQFLEHPNKYVHRVTEGIRTNILDIFDSIAYFNSFPAEHLPLLAFNQMVLKAIFNERPLYCIKGVSGRLNKDLALTSLDYINERWSAGRKITPEIWRLLIPILNEKHHDLLSEGIQSGDEVQAAAIKLAIHESKNEGLKKDLSPYSPTITWGEIGETVHKK